MAIEETILKFSPNILLISFTADEKDNFFPKQYQCSLISELSVWISAKHRCTDFRNHLKKENMSLLVRFSVHVSSLIFLFPNAFSYSLKLLDSLNYRKFFINTLMKYLI